MQPPFSPFTTRSAAPNRIDRTEQLLSSRPARRPFLLCDAGAKLKAGPCDLGMQGREVNLSLVDKLAERSPLQHAEVVLAKLAEHPVAGPQRRGVSRQRSQTATNVFEAPTLCAG